MSNLRLYATILALSAAPVCGALADPLEDEAPATTLTAHSASAAVSGKFTVNTTAYKLPAQLLASGNAPPAYDSKVTKPSFTKAITLPYYTELDVKTGTTTDEAKSAGVVSSQIVATATSSIKNSSVVLKNQYAGTLFTLTATSIGSNAKFTRTSTGVGTAAGGSSISTLTIVLAPALGGKTLTFTGNPSANQILYKNTDGSFIIYLNRKSINVAFPTVADPATAANNIEVDAIDFHLTNLNVAGVATVNGDVRVGSSYAK